MLLMHVIHCASCVALPLLLAPLLMVLLVSVWYMPMSLSYFSRQHITFGVIGILK